MQIIDETISILTPLTSHRKKIILQFIIDNPGCKQYEIIEKTGWSQSSVSQNCTQLKNMCCIDMASDGTNTIYNPNPSLDEWIANINKALEPWLSAIKLAPMSD